jgi:regulator of RNase E activity RraB
MPYIIVHCWYPDHLADQVAKKYLELMEKYQSDESLVKTLVPVAVTATKNGIEAMTVEEVEKQRNKGIFEFDRISGLKLYRQIKRSDIHIKNDTW